MDDCREPPCSRREELELMKRRTLLKLLAGAAATLALPKASPEQEPNLISNGDMIHDLNSYNTLGDATGVSELHEQNLGRQWILDPTIPRDTIYAYNRHDFVGTYDARMLRELARFEFRQREMWPRSARITNLAAPGDIDAL